MKTKTKLHGDEVTDFYDKKIPKIESNHTCLAVMSLDFNLKDDNYCPYFFNPLWVTFAMVMQKL